MISFCISGCKVYSSFHTTFQSRLWRLDVKDDHSNRSGLVFRDHYRQYWPTFSLAFTSSYQNIFDTALLGGNYGVIDSYIIELDYKIAFATAFGYLPEFDFEGNLLGITTIMDFDERRIPFNYVTIFPCEKNSYIIYSWLKEDESYFEKFLEQLKGLSILDIKRCFNNLIPEYSENIIINPKLWNRFSDFQKEEFTTSLRNINIEREYDLRNEEGINRKLDLKERAAFNLFRRI